MAQTKEEKAAYDRAYREKNKELLIAKHREYNAINKEEKAAYDKAYNIRNRERIANIGKARNELKKDVISAYHKEYYAKNKDRINARIKSRRTINHIEYNEKVRLYAKSPKGRALKNARTRKAQVAKIQRTPTWLSETDKWMVDEIYILSALRTQLTGVEWHVDHIIPLRGKKVSGLHIPSNLQVITAKENLSKGNRL